MSTLSGTCHQKQQPPQQQLGDDIDAITIHSKPGSEKVDFVTVLSPQKSSPLAQAVNKAASVSTPNTTII